MTKIITIKQMALGLLLLCFASVTFAQRKSLNVGDLWYETDAGMLDDDIVFPQGWVQATSIESHDSPNNTSNEWDINQLDMLHAHGVKIATKRTWTDNTGSPWDYQIAEVTGGRFTDEGMVMVPVSGAFKRTFRNPFPTKTLDGVDRTDILAAADDDVPTIPADVMIYNKLDGWPDYGMALQLERWAYAFANTEYDDFVILEYLVTNTHASETRDSVYLALTSETNAHTFYTDADMWGNYYGVDYWKHLNAGGTDATADSMRIWYSWDAHDHQEAGDSKGRLDPLWGTIREPQYTAYVVIHADKAPDDPTDDPHQPVKAGWSCRNFAPNLLEYTHPEMWEFFSQGWDMANAGLGTYPEKYSYAFDENYNQVSGGMYRALYSDKNNSGNGIDVRDYDRMTEEDKQSLFSFGPYQLGPGQDVRVVVAFAGGTIDLKTAIDAGRAYDNGYPDQYVIIPLPNAITDLEGNVIAAAGATLTKDQKDQILDLGKDHAFNNAAKAVRVWKNGSVEAGAGDFGIDLAPATPSLTGTSENDQVRLQWGNEAANDVGITGTIDGYRIYRNYYRPPAVESPCDTTFVQIDQVAATAREYVDLTVARGQDYYYYLVAVTTGDVESSWFLNLTGTTAKREDEALSPTRSFDPDWQDNVVVVPNPYHARGADKYSGRRLVFLNLPEFANIHIYTVTGDRVQTLEHVKGVGDKDWELQDTFSTMEIVSGVYIYVVEELDEAGGEPTGEKAIGKFVVIK